MVTVELDPVCVEACLSAGEILCPACGVGVLGGWGHARAWLVVGDQAGRVRPRRISPLPRSPVIWASVNRPWVTGSREPKKVVWCRTSPSM